MYRPEASEESVTRHVNRQLPESLLVNYRDHKLCALGQFTSYRQALHWIKENQSCLKRFINILRLYPNLIQENAYDPFWNFIQPLLPTSTEGRTPSPSPDGNRIPVFSPATGSPSHVNPARDQSGITTVTDSTSANCTSAADSLKTSPSRKKENYPPRNSSSIPQPNSNQSLSLHGRGIMNIPSIFVSAELSVKDSPNSELTPTVYSSKVFLCKDPTDIEDSMSMALLSSLSSVSFVHCLPPTIEPVKSLIPECDAFIFIMNSFTISASDCLSQLKQAQLLHLPIQFIRYHDFQLPPNLEEIVKVSLASDTDLDQYLSIRRRSYVTSTTSSPRGSRCSSDREASPDRSCSPLPYREKHKTLLPCLASPGNGISESSSKNSTARTISMIVTCLKDGYQKAQLYNSKYHLACVSQIIDSVSKLLESPLSYNTAYFQLKKKRQATPSTYQQSLYSKPTVGKAWSYSSYEAQPNKQSSSNWPQSRKHKQAPKTFAANRRNRKDSYNLVPVPPTHRPESKSNNPPRRHRQASFIKSTPQISRDSSDSHSLTSPTGNAKIKTKPLEDSDNDHEEDDDDDDDEDDEDDDDEEEDEDDSSLEFPSLQDDSTNNCPSEEKETSYVVYPDCNSTYNKKPTVIKWPVAWNQLEYVKRQEDSQKDETDSTSTNFFDVDLTRKLQTSSEED